MWWASRTPGTFAIEDTLVSRRGRRCASTTFPSFPPDRTSRSRCATSTTAFRTSRSGKGIAQACARRALIRGVLPVRSMRIGADPSWPRSGELQFEVAEIPAQASEYNVKTQLTYLPLPARAMRVAGEMRDYASQEERDVALERYETLVERLEGYGQSLCSRAIGASGSRRKWNPAPWRFRAHSTRTPSATEDRAVEDRPDVHGCCCPRSRCPPAASARTSTRSRPIR